MFGLLMQDNTPVDPRYRGVGYAPGGPYYPRGARLGFVPGGPYYRRFRGYGDHTPGVPGVPHGFGEDIPTSGMYSQPLGPVQESTGWTRQGTLDVINTVFDATGKVIGAVTSTGQTYYQGSCGAGSVYVPSADRCVATSGGGGSNTGLLVAGAVGLGILALVLGRRG